MKISETTFNVLKNFAKINSGMVIKPGNVQRTISEEKNIFVEAILEETFPTVFGIYDLNLFLANLSTFIGSKTADFTFEENKLDMRDGGISLTYWSSQPDMIITPPDKKLIIDNPNAVFELKNEVMGKLQAMASVNDLPNLTFYNKGRDLLAKAHNKSNPASNVVQIHLDDTFDGEEFSATFTTESIKLMPNDYVVDIKKSDKNSFARFVNSAKTMTYFISLDTK